jgi:hypothetical protein
MRKRVYISAIIRQLGIEKCPQKADSMGIWKSNKQE